MNKEILNNKEQKAPGGKFTIEYILNNYKAVKNFLSTLQPETDKNDVKHVKNINTNERENSKIS